MSPQPNQTKHDSYAFISGPWYSRNSWWRHQMEHFPHYWSFVRGIPKASDAKIWCFLWSVWTNVWANNRDAAELRRDRAHYDVTEMCDADQTIAIDQNMAWSQAFLLCSSFSFTVGNIGFKTLMWVSFSDIHWKNSCWFRFAFTEPWRH